MHVCTRITNSENDWKLSKSFIRGYKTLTHKNGKEREEDIEIGRISEIKDTIILIKGTNQQP